MTSQRRPLLAALGIATIIWVTPLVLLMIDTKRSDAWVIVGAIGAAGQALGVLAAVWYARRQLNDYRSGQRAQRHAELLDRAAAIVLEEMPAVVIDAERALRDIMLLLEHPPDKPDAPPPEYIKRWNEFHDHARLAAAALHALTVRARWVMTLLDEVSAVDPLVVANTEFALYLKPYRPSLPEDRLRDVRAISQHLNEARNVIEARIETLLVLTSVVTPARW